MQTNDFLDWMRQEAVWIKGLIVTGFDPNTWRQDQFGYWIKKQDYGNRNSEYGWEIHHAFPAAVGGSDHINNLMPLHWKNNASIQP